LGEIRKATIACGGSATFAESADLAHKETADDPIDQRIADSATDRYELINPGRGTKGVNS
jgi:hypothetical protein